MMLAGGRYRISRLGVRPLPGCVIGSPAFRKKRRVRLVRHIVDAVVSEEKDDRVAIAGPSSDSRF